MRFKKYLDKHKYQPYAERYLKFDELMCRVNEGLSQGREAEFVEFLDNNLNEVFCFIQFKHEDFENRMASVEELINGRKGTRELAELQDEIHAFAEFIRINIEGFKTVIAKHDKKSGLDLISKYKKTFKKKLGEVEGLSKLMYSASRLKLKTLSIKQEKESGTSFVRKTRKYWVHNENLYSLKLRIIKNLPVYVYDPNPEGSPFSVWNHRLHDTCVSSVYLDNASFEVYVSRLQKNQGAEAIRIRWYGSKVTPIVFIERKRHEDGWTGLSSEKLRFKIAEKYVTDYLNGKNVWEHVKMLNGSEVFGLYKEVQTAVVAKSLRPMVRTFYMRNAFQLPNDSSVRISLDTNLVMIRECSKEDLEASALTLRGWRRPDAECEWPFKHIAKEDIVRFPHAILEVKTQGVDETHPLWIEELVSSSYVEHVHKYSKFMHGTAVLYKQIELIPYWLPQMATDIRKDPFHPIKSVKRIENNRVVDYSGEDENANSESLSLVEEHGKKIAMPIRIEPKVFFANERTFLRWIQFAVFLGGVGTAILGLGDYEAALCGSMLMIVSVMFTFYALYTFKWRTEKIRIRFPGPYDDLVGPTVLVCVFLLAMLLSVVFKYPASPDGDDIF